jgi:hypothetical protein
MGAALHLTGRDLPLDPIKQQILLARLVHEYR